MFTIIGAMAELERNIIRERVLAGMEHARRFGTRSGQPMGRPKAVFDRDEVVRLRKEGLSWRQIARKLRIGASMVRRVCEHANPADSEPQTGEKAPAGPGELNTNKPEQDDKDIAVTDLKPALPKEKDNEQPPEFQ